MANKRIKQKASTSADTAQTLWLAGLGALSITQKRGGALLTGLIAEGRDFQARVRRFVHEIGADAQSQLKGAVAPLRMHARDNVKKAGELIERTVALALGRFGVPSKADIEALSQRMGALSRQLKTAK